MKMTKLISASMFRIGVFGTLFAAASSICSGQEENLNAVAKKTDATAPVEKQQDKIKVVFDDANPGVVYVESNGERVRVDVNKKTVEPAATLAGTPAAAEANPAETAIAPQVEESAYSFGDGEEPYDSRLINV